MAKSPIPYVGIISGAVAGSAGAAVAIAGGVQIVHARSQIGRHEERYENRHADHLAQVECTNEALRTFGQTQERARRDVILRMVDFLKRNAKKVKVSEQLIVDGLEASITRVLSTAKLDPDVTGWIQGFVNSAVAGGGAAVGIGRCHRVREGQYRNQISA